ncbi:hypothetical protein Jann_3534 [Jannaschia sp. CCS1]|nr:hypothetical protein Jann_3534 [Jannaschia sp. CCS1]
MRCPNAYKTDLGKKNSPSAKLRLVELRTNAKFEGKNRPVFLNQTTEFLEDFISDCFHRLNRNTRRVEGSDKLRLDQRSILRLNAFKSRFLQTKWDT